VVGRLFFVRKVAMVRGIMMGAMDLLHAGQVLALKECKAQCDHLIVALHTDPSIDRPLTKNKPIETVEERLIRLEGCRYVDEIVMYDTEADGLELLKRLKPDIRFIGADWKGKWFPGRDEYNTIYVSRDHNYGSARLRKRIREAPFGITEEK
jgi:glycerol-3-phosphate cytidylyltransferase